MPSQTQQQKQNALNAAGLNATQQSGVNAGIGYAPTSAPPATSSNPSPISIENVNNPVTPVNVPPAPTPKDYSGLTSTNLESLLASFNAPTTQESNTNSLQQRILDQMGTLSGESARKTTLETDAGLPGQRTELQNYVNQLQALQKEQLAIPLQIQQEAQGLGATAGGVAPLQAARLRENAIKSLSLAAAAQTLQGNISLAETNIQNALDAEFQPEKDKLEVLKQLYQFNKDDLERTDKKRADTLNILLNERNRQLDLQKADKQEIYNIGLTAAKYGADSATVQKIMSSSSRGDALAAAGASLQDPKAQYDVENARLQNILTKVQIDKANKEISLLGQPTKEELKAQSEALKTAEAAIPVMQDKLTLIDAIKNNDALRAVVGPNAFARGQIPVPLPLGLGFNIPVSKARLTGEAQNFIGGIQKLVGGLTLDNLIAAKARGATFGALSDGELGILANSATAINNWAIKDKEGNVVGYNVSESAFNDELDTIKMLTQRALQQQQGSLFSPEEQDVLNELGATSFNPSF